MSPSPHAETQARVAAARAEFRRLITDDVNVPGALGVMFDLVRDAGSPAFKQVAALLRN